MAPDYDTLRATFAEEKKRRDNAEKMQFIYWNEKDDILLRLAEIVMIGKMMK